MKKDPIIDDQPSSPTMRTFSALKSRKRCRCAWHSLAGFTMVELIVVTAIIGVLAGLAIPAYNSFVVSAKVTRAKQEIRLLETEIIAYFLENESYPADLVTIGRDTMTDPWGHVYIYNEELLRTSLAPLNSDFDLFSKGGNGETAPDVDAGPGKDDVVRGANGYFLDLGQNWTGI